MGTVTIRGGTGEPDQTLVYTDAGAFQLAAAIAKVVNANLAIDVKLYKNGGVFKIPATVGALVIEGSKPVTIAAAAGTKKQYVVAGKLGVDYTAAAGESVSIAGIGADTIFAGQSTLAGTRLDAAGTRDLIELGAGAVTVTEAGTLARIKAGSGTAIIHDTGVNDTVTAGSGAETIYASKNGHYILGDGQDVIQDSQAKGASDTIDANGGGGYTVLGGAADVITSNTGLVFAGGSATLKGSGSDTILGAAGTAIDDKGSGASVFVAGAGSETFGAAGTAANLTLFSSTDPSATDIITSGNGSNIFELLGSNATLTGGAGSSLFEFVDQGSTSQAVLITNFNTANDYIGLSGFAAGASQSALNSAITAGNITTITLPDGTTVQFLGAPALTAGNFA